jgi:hypothetical protein
MLIGLLSMFYAEILSGASQLWYLNHFGVLYTLPLYLLHTIILMNIALRLKRTKLYQLYIFGMIFSLYEAVITKVLWAGYMNESGPAFGPWLGIAPLEFIILVFFWHPIFSFILPILTYEWITSKILEGHQRVFERLKKHMGLILVGIIIVSSFVANGNQYDLMSGNLAPLGTLLIIFILVLLSKKKLIPLTDLEKIPKLMYAILMIIYLFGGIVLVPKRFPSELISYIMIIVFYVLFFLMLRLSRKTSDELISLNHTFNYKHLTVAILCFFVSLNLSIIFSSISSVILMISYWGMALVGLIIFFLVIVKLIRQK